MKQYEYPACFTLVTDFYLNEFGFEFKNFDIQGKNIKQLRTAFVLSILKDKLFYRTDYPKDGSIVLMYKDYADRPNHCGIYIQNRILHALNTLVVWQSLSALTDYYNKIEYGDLHVN